MKKKIVILTSTGGNGHIAVSNALKDILSPTYNVVVLNVFSDVLRPLDYTQRMTRNRYTGESFYNLLLKHQWIRLINLMKYGGKWLYSMQSITRAGTLIEARLRTEHADLVISVVPFINGAIAHAARELKIPMLMIPTDFDITTFLYGIDANNLPGTFRIALPSGDARVMAPLDVQHIDRNYCSVTGFVLRPAFYQQPDVRTIKRNYSITDERPVVLVMLGSQGSQSLYAYAQQLLTMSVPAHVVILVGRNSALIERLNTLPVPAHITLHVLGFTDDVASLMAMADVFITKSGSISVAEGLQMHVPMLLDATSRLLAWEKLNHTLLQQYGAGDSITAVRKAPHMVQALLADPALRQNIRLAMARMTEKNGAGQVKNLIHQMLAGN